MKKKIIISIISFVALSASAQHFHTGSSGDYKHPQMAQKAQAAEAEKLAADTSTHELVYEKNDNYKDQTNNVLRVKGRRKKTTNDAPTNTDTRRRQGDYKHPNGLW
ncbi:MAG TPA: hypothetical protein VL947_07500 [Cytophagales bacterium]|nr:hypothetical protein [Cytophagales bacterium]